MTILDLLLHQDMTPFTLALLLVAGLLLLEIVLGFVGITLLGAGDADIDADFDANIDAGIEPDFDGDIEAAADGAEGDSTSVGSPGLLSWLGLGKAPLAIWFAAALTGFGLTGYAIQAVAEAIFGGLLPVFIAAPVAAVLGLAFARRFAGGFARIMPQHESYGISRRSFGGRHGVIVQGTARRGHPAQARFRDGYGETHYVRVEPIDDGTEIPTGTEVAILSGPDGTLRALPLTDQPLTAKGD